MITISNLKVKGKDISFSTSVIGNSGLTESHNYNLDDYKMLWKVVDYVDWENNYNSSSKRKVLSNSMSEAQSEQLEKEFFDLKVIVKNVIRGYLLENEFSGNGNNYEDFISHMIGKGKDYLIETLGSRDKTLDRIKNLNYKESFRYVIPYVYEVKDSLINDAMKRINENIVEVNKNINDLCRMDCFSQTYKDSLVQQTKPFLDLLGAAKNKELKFLSGVDFNLVTREISNFNKDFYLVNHALSKDNKNFNGTLNCSLSYAVKDYVENSSFNVEEKIDFSNFGSEYIDSFKKEGTTNNVRDIKSRPKI